jgi:hypothetical protein
MDVLQAALDGGDLATAQSISNMVSDDHFKHDAALAIATADVNLSQYQAAEDAVEKLNSPDAEAAVCGIISASLARTRGPEQAQQWIDRLTTPSDRIAARLAVAQVLQSKPVAPAAK